MGRFRSYRTLGREKSVRSVQRCTFFVADHRPIWYNIRDPIGNQGGMDRILVRSFGSTTRNLEGWIILKKGIRIIYFVTVVISALVGLWHFFVPWMFQWYDYLPMQYENLIVGIDYTNYCFSLLLLGLSVMLILLGKRALDMNREVIYFYFFLTVVWMFRACLASFIEPWPLQPIPAAAIGQLVASDALAIMMVVVSGCFIIELRRK